MVCTSSYIWYARSDPKTCITIVFLPTHRFKMLFILLISSFWSLYPWKPFAFWRLLCGWISSTICIFIYLLKYYANLVFKILYFQIHSNLFYKNLCFWMLTLKSGVNLVSWCDDSNPFQIRFVFQFGFGLICLSFTFSNAISNYANMTFVTFSH